MATSAIKKIDGRFDIWAGARSIGGVVHKGFNLEFLNEHVGWFPTKKEALSAARLFKHQRMDDLSDITARYSNPIDAARLKYEAALKANTRTPAPRGRKRVAAKKTVKRVVRRANPIGHGKLAIWLNAGNNTSGNPRRLYVVVTTSGVVEGVYDEGYDGPSAVTSHHPGIEIVGQFMITPAQYRDLLKHPKAK